MINKCMNIMDNEFYKIPVLYINNKDRYSRVGRESNREMSLKPKYVFETFIKLMKN